MKSLFVAASLAVMTLAGVGAAYAGPPESYLEYQDRMGRTVHLQPQNDGQRQSSRASGIDSAGKAAEKDAASKGQNAAGQAAAGNAAREAAGRQNWD